MNDRADPDATPQRRDLEFTIYESVLLPLPAATRKAVLIGPPGSTYRITVALTDAAATNAQAGVLQSLRDGSVTVSGFGSVTAEYWPRGITTLRREIIDGRSYLQIFPDDADLPADPPAAGDYQFFGYPAGWVERADNNAYVPLAYGRLRLRARPHYFNALDTLDEQLERMRDALTTAAPDSSALVEVETPDGNRQRYAGVRTLLAAIHDLENRRAYLLATNNGRTPLAGFELTA